MFLVQLRCVTCYDQNDAQGVTALMCAAWNTCDPEELREGHARKSIPALSCTRHVCARTEVAAQGQRTPNMRMILLSFQFAKVSIVRFTQRTSPSFALLSSRQAGKLRLARQQVLQSTLGRRNAAIFVCSAIP